MYNPEGTISFDLKPNEKFAKTKTCQGLNNLDNFQGEAVLSFSLDDTAKNRLLLKQYFSPNQMFFDYQSSIPVIAFEAGQPMLQDRLRVTKKTDSSNNYEATLLSSENDWVSSLQGCKLKDFDLGSFTFTKDNIETSWQNHIYQDGGQKYYWELVHRGNWRNKATYDENGNLSATTSVYPEDLTLTFFATALLQCCFCEKGWTFKSPIFEHPVFRRAKVYILGQNQTYTGQGQAWDIEGNIRLDVGIPLTGGDADGSLPFFASVDPSGSWNVDINVPNPTSYYYKSTSDTPQCIKGCVNLTLQNTDTVSKTFTLEWYDRINSTVHYSYSITIPPNDTINLEVCSNEITPAQNAEIIWRFTNLPIGLGFTLKGGSTMSIEVCKDRIYLNDTIQLNEPIDDDYDFLDFFKGMLHLIGGGKILVDPITKTITVYPTFDITMPDGSVVEGFSRSEQYAKYITNLIIKDSCVMEIGDPTQNRYIKLCFASDGDDYAETLGHNEDNPLWGQIIDLGADKNLIEDITESCNPFFEPTANIDAYDITPDGANPVNIPAFWDNTNNEYSTDIGPRILLNRGVERQYDVGVSGQGGITTLFNKWNWCGVATEELPNAHQCTNQGITGANTPPELCLSYDGKQTDLFTLIWKDIIDQIASPISLEFLVCIDRCFYNAETFRDPFFIQYGGRSFYALLQSINDFRSCDNLSTPLKFIPKPNKPTNC